MKECEDFKQHQVCDKEKYIEQCLDKFGAKEEQYYEKESESKPACPGMPVPNCGESSFVKSMTDANGCISYYCEASDVKCPEANVPSCPDGNVVEKKVDEKGCAYYYCKQMSCPEVSKPACS